MTGKPLVTNPNDPAQVEAAEKKEKTREQIRAEAWRAVLSSEDARLVLQEILNIARVGKAVADVDSVNRTFMLLGEQNVGHWIKDQIKLFHQDALWQMEREQTKRMEGT